MRVCFRNGPLLFCCSWEMREMTCFLDDTSFSNGPLVIISHVSFFTAPRQFTICKQALARTPSGRDGWQANPGRNINRSYYTCIIL